MELSWHAGVQQWLVLCENLRFFFFNFSYETKQKKRKRFDQQLHVRYIIAKEGVFCDFSPQDDGDVECETKEKKSKRMQIWTSTMNISVIMNNKTLDVDLPCVVICVVGLEIPVSSKFNASEVIGE